MFLVTKQKRECFGCEACVQVCATNAITMKEDVEGFRYPAIDETKCVQCRECNRVCPQEACPPKHIDDKYVFGGFHNEAKTRFESTSGGAFSAIVDSYCDTNYVVFGAESHGLLVFHSYVFDKADIGKYRKSKYSQSVIGNSYKDVKQFLVSGKKVIFSGTPCQVAGLLAFLGSTNTENLLTVEVVCEGVPSPLYIRKLDECLQRKYGKSIETIDYRYTGRSLFFHGKWDFQVMKIALNEKKQVMLRDRWFNPFWSIWLDHLMSRPSCYKCLFTTAGRVADITLGDLWGVHLYCPELYGRNGGSSLVVCNTVKGKEVFKNAEILMQGHELRFEDALKYQSPMQKNISENSDREAFMMDLESNMEYQKLISKWAHHPSIKLLFQKYVWGNRQKIFVWNLRKRICRKRGRKNA